MSEGQERIGAHGDFHAWVEPSGAVRIGWRGRQATLLPEDRFEVEFGGPSAAVGFVPIVVWYHASADGAVHGVISDGVDDRSDEDPHELYARIVALLGQVAERAGCDLNA